MPRFLYTLDELLTVQHNAWACPDCGAAWLDVFPGVDALAVPAVPSSDPSCKHPSLRRATLSSSPA